jgi:hypothetical protein
MAQRIHTKEREALIRLQVLRLPSPSETRPRPQRKPSGGSSPSRWGNSKAGAIGAATANGRSLQRPLSFRRVASTIARRKHLHLQGRRSSRKKIASCVFVPTKTLFPVNGGKGATYKKLSEGKLSPLIIRRIWRPDKGEGKPSLSLSVEAPLSIGDTATATAEALWRLFPFSMGQQ